MTKEEAQIIIGNIPIKPEALDDCYDITEYQAAKAMAIKALDQRWIPVSERLPELEEIVLIYDKAFGYLTAKYSEVVDDYDEKNTVFLTHYSISSDKWASMYPIAWMPIESYTEDVQ